jgi:hypothetical protein
MTSVLVPTVCTYEQQLISNDKCTILLRSTGVSGEMLAETISPSKIGIFMPDRVMYLIYVE